jgi:glycosyltransferase involved in cell wall biosynthesis
VTDTLDRHPAPAREASPVHGASPTIAVLIPCYQEERTIGKVVSDFRAALPQARIYVYDNNSTDATAARALEAGAIVRREKRQGKGFVLASMFAQVDADIYVLVDGDDTYDAASAPKLIAPLLREEADMTVGSRLTTFDESAFRRMHVGGNQLVSRTINLIFGADIRDLFSGYRGMTRELVKQVPVLARGFDVETELTLQALYRGFVIREIPTPYGTRPEGSHSKLRTLPDGFRVLLKLFLMLQAYKPLTFFGSLGILCAVASLLAGSRPVIEYMEYQYVYAVPRAVLAAALAVMALLSAGIGVILHSTNFRLQEIERVLVKRAPARPDDRTSR